LTTLGAFGRFLESLKSIKGFGLLLQHLKTYGRLWKPVEAVKLL